MARKSFYERLKQALTAKTIETPTLPGNVEDTYVAKFPLEIFTFGVHSACGEYTTVLPAGHPIRFSKFETDDTGNYAIFIPQGSEFEQKYVVIYEQAFESVLELENMTQSNKTSVELYEEELFTQLKEKYNGDLK